MTDSIVILHYGEPEDTRSCLESLRRTCDERTEVILIDQDGNGRAAAGDMIDWSALRILTPGQNLGFARGCNLGALAASGQFLWFVNNDTMVASGWQEAMRDALADGRYAAVGPVSDGTGELQEDWRPRYVQDWPSGFDVYAAERLDRYRSQRWRFPRLAGFFLGIRASAFRVIGGFDESFGSGYFEDDHLCWKLRQAGYLLAVVPSVFVYHRSESPAYGKARANRDWLMVRNRHHFLECVGGFRHATEGPVVSILTTTKDRLDLLPLALRSVCAQTYRNWEAVVVNDGGASIKAVAEACEDSRIRPFDRPWEGRGKALNFALHQARGDLIAYLDDDDEWLPHHLAIVVAAIQDTGAGFAYSDSVCERVRGGDRACVSRFIRSASFALDVLDRGNYIPTLSVLHKASLVDEVGLFDVSLPVIEDWDYWRRLTTAAEVVHVPVVTGIWRVQVDHWSRNGLMARNPETYGTIERAIRLSPLPMSRLTSEILRLRAGLLAQQGCVTEAVGLLEQATSLNPRSEFAIADLSYWLRRLGRPITPGERSRLEGCARSVPTSFDLWKAAALAALACGDHLGAEEHLAMCLVTRPNEEEGAVVYEMLSWCYATIGEVDSAAACRARALQVRDPLLRRQVLLGDRKSILALARAHYEDGGPMAVIRAGARKILRSI